MKCMLKAGFRCLLVFFVLSSYLCCVVPVYAQADQPGADGGDDVPSGDGLGDGSDSPDDGDSGSGDGDGALPDDGDSGDGSDSPDDGDSGSGDGDGAPADGDDDSGDDGAGSDDDEREGTLMGTASAPGAGSSAEECSQEYACAGEPPKLCYMGRWIDVLDYEVNCVDGIDNDCDGSIDGEDTDCYQAAKPVKISKEEIKCIPECRATGTRSEGWYDSCTVELIKWDNCEGCYAVCKAIGSRSEGWYNSCDGELIKYDNCGGEMPACGNGICEAGETQSSCPEDCSKGKTIIIRSDDIGPWWSVDNAIYVTDLVRNMGVPQTLGIVPITAGGTIRLEQDPKLVSYLETLRTDANVEFAIHGLNHDVNEFLGISQPEAEEKIADARQMIGDSLHVEPVTFVPPYYAYDESTLYAARSQGMKYFSAGWNAIDMGHGFLEHPPGLWNIPVTTDFYDWGGNSLYSADEIEVSCANAMDRFGTCVIVVHHQLFVDSDYNIDQEKIALLTEVMQWVKTREAQGVELKTIGKHKLLSPPPSKNKYIVFRSDDIGPFWSDESAIAITETLRERGVPQVLSIVPANEYDDMLYDDPVMSGYLRSIKNDASVEFALHGYDHGEHEFRDISYHDAVSKIDRGLDILQSVVGTAPITFVPPYHEYNGNTLRALRTGNINLISSGYDDFMNGMAFTEDEHGILHLPIVAEFYNWGENRINTAQEIERSCEYGMDNYNVCVIMLHHHMFVDSEGNMDPARVKVLTDVIEWAKDKEQEDAADIVRLKDIDVDDL